MKTYRKQAIPFTSTIFFLLIFLIGTSNAWAFHAGIACSSCHNLFRNDPRNPYLAIDNPTDVCLSCHDANKDQSGLNPPHVLNGTALPGGGSFTSTLFSDQTGHNMVTPDAVLGFNPPGGGFMTEFNCISCHDPHDNGNYRNLKIEINGIPTPVEVDGDPTYRNNIYLSGMDQFCAACHDQFHGRANTLGRNSWVRHPTGITLHGAPHADFSGWSQRKPVLTLVENPSGNPNDIYNAKVFCLSCHFAHAGPYDNAVRWDNARSNKGCLECHSLDDD